MEEEKYIKREIEIGSIESIYDSYDSNQMILHIAEERDVRFQTLDIQTKYELINSIIEAHQLQTQKKTYTIYYPPKKSNLKEYYDKDLSNDRRIRREKGNLQYWKQKHNGRIEEIRKAHDDSIFKLNLIKQLLPKQTVQKCFAGKIEVVLNKSNNHLYTLKTIRKDWIIDNKMEPQIIKEQDILYKIYQAQQHPFLVQLLFIQQDDDHIYFGMPFYPGGILYNHLQFKDKLSQQQVKFYAASLILALEYLHKQGYIFIDLVPENVILDQEGYALLWDFEISQQIASIDKSKRSGAIEYRAPEIFETGSYTEASDWWSLGCLIYNLIVGYEPFDFNGSKPEERYDEIFKQPWIPNSFQNEYGGIKKEYKQLMDLLSQLFIKDPEQRLGSGKNGSLDIKNHRWFGNIDFQLLYEKQVENPDWKVSQNQYKDSMKYYDYSKVTNDNDDYGQVMQNYDYDQTVLDAPFKQFRFMSGNFKF